MFKASKLDQIDESKKPININSPITEIAQDIGDKYLLRPFPSKFLPNGLLDYTKIRGAKINRSRLERPIHGYQNACRMAGLIPVLIKLYKKYAGELPLATQQQLANLSPLEIKKIQIVAMLRATGRTEDGGSGIDFCQQGKKECLYYLESIGVEDPKEREYLSQAIVDSERVDSEDLATCLIADASTIETFRDTVGFTTKTIYISYFGFTKLLKKPISAYAIDDFLKLTFKHLELIRKHQGFLLSTIKGFDDEPISKYSPGLDEKPIADKSHQLKVELEDDLFKKINEEIALFDQVIENKKALPTLENLESLFSKLDDEIDNFPLLYPDPTSVLKISLDFLSPCVGKIYNYKGNYFCLSWSDVKKHFEKYGNYEQILKNWLINNSLIKLDNESFSLVFSNVDDCIFGLRIARIFLSDRFPDDVEKLVGITDGINFRFRLSKYNLAYLFVGIKPDFFTVANIPEDVKKLSELIKKADVKEAVKLISMGPGLLKFPADDGDFPIHVIVRKNNLELLQYIVDNYQAEINLQNQKGETALFLACEEGYLSIVNYLLSIRHVRLDLARTADGKTPLEISQDNKHDHISKAILDSQTKLIKPIKEKSDSLPVSSFEEYALTLRKMPNDKLYWRYLKEINLMASNYKSGVVTSKFKLSTKTEKEFIKSRKIWSDVVSETYKQNQTKPNVKQLVIERLKNHATANDFESVYESCIKCLRDHSVITMTFDASFLYTKGLTDFQLLNMFERDNRNSRVYTRNRDITESNLFAFLTPELREAFFENPHARPRYGTLMLIDDGNPVNWTGTYGKSFIVFKDVVKLNSIFSPSDSLNYSVENSSHYNVCTFHNLELILLQCPVKTLIAILRKVSTGSFGSDFSQHQSDHANGGYIEVMIPPLNLFSDVVETIFINQNEYQINQDKIQLMQQMGINVLSASAASTPYTILTNIFKEAIKKDDAKKVNELLIKYPSLKLISEEGGFRPVHIAAKHECVEVLKVFGAHNLSFISMTDKGDFTPLQIAAYHGKKHALEYILARVVKETRLDEKTILNNNRVILSLAQSPEPNLDCLEFILKRDVDLEVTDRGWNALHDVSKNGHLKLAKILIDHGINVNAKKRDNWIPLHLAIINNNTEIVELLLRSGTDLKIFMEVAETAETKYKKMFFAFIENHIKNILNSKSYDVVTALIKQNKTVLTIPINAKKQTLLHVYAMRNDSYMMQLILQQNSFCVQEKDIEGNTPLHLIFLQRKIDVSLFSQLLKCGPNIFEANLKGDTPLHYFYNNIKNIPAKVITLTLDYFAGQVEENPCFTASDVKSAMILATEKQMHHLSFFFGKVYLNDYIINLEKNTNHFVIQFFNQDEKKLAAAKTLKKVIEGKENPEALIEYQSQWLNNEFELIYKAVKPFFAVNVEAISNTFSLKN